MINTSIFIVPRSSTAWQGNEAGWITASGWAAAGEQLWGEAIVATTDGIYSPRESRLFPKKTLTSKEAKINSSVRNLIPEFFITAYKDLALKKSKPKIWPIEKEGALDGKKVTMVWERHDLFPGPGKRLADKLGVPLIISVEAPAVWEATKWGVTRPGWGSLLEKYGEAKSLKGADIVCCVSEEVRLKVVSMGVEPERVIVTPNRVDSSIFNPTIDGRKIAEKYNLSKKRVIGWTGSFRSFHGLDSVLRAFKIVCEKNHDVMLMLVGDGQEFVNVKALSEELGIADRVILPGRQPFTDIPTFVKNFDIALVSASSAEGFHYSPLKLREYLAVGKAVVAPRAGELPGLFRDGSDLLFYEPGNARDLADKLSDLLENTQLQNSLQINAKAWFEQEGTWLHELKRVCDILSIKY